MIRLPVPYNAGNTWTDKKTRIFNRFYKILSVFPEGKFKKDPELLFLGELTSLRELFLYFYKQKVDLKVLEKCLDIEYLDLCGTIPSARIDLSKHKNLETVVFDDHENLQSIYQNKSIKHLKITAYKSLDLTRIVNMENLKSLTIFSSSSLLSIKGIEKLPNLSLIEIERCAKLSDISSYSNIDRAIKLRINGSLIYRSRDLSSDEMEVIKKKFGKRRVDIYFRD